VLKHTLFFTALCYLAFLFSSQIILAADSIVSVTVLTAACADGIDNDSDLLIDYPADPGCSSSLDNSETDPPPPECSDSIDNDSDGNIDYPADLGCDNALDTTEAGEILPTPTTASSGGGGNGPILPLTGTHVIFLGQAFPGATISVLADGLFVGLTKVNPDNTFKLDLPEIPPGTYIFNIYATDALGRSTRPLSYALNIARGLTTQISGIILKLSEIKEPSSTCPLKGDLNSDCRVDLLDFSIASYWWNRALDSKFKVIEAGELNGDGTITLEDFSILAYHWTG